MHAHYFTQTVLVKLRLICNCSIEKIKLGQLLFCVVEKQKTLHQQGLVVEW